MTTHSGFTRQARILLLVLFVIFLVSGMAQAARDEDPPYDAKLFPNGIAADTTDIVDSVATATMTFHAGTNTLRLPYFANHPIEGTYPNLTRGLIVICGTLRNADDYFKYVSDAGVTAGRADTTTLIIAPQFLTEPDLDAHNLPEDYLFWSYMGWRQGDQSLDSDDHPRPARFSSFALTDSILFWMAERLPNLTQVVVCGHSAGGQFLNRYAAGTPMHQVLQSGYGVPVRYVVSNPSSYMYWNEERWVEETTYTFAVPSPETIADCPTYNDYKYGLQSLNQYMNIGSQVLMDQYASRQVIYLLGGADTDPHSTYLDIGCEAMLQGSQRLERGVVYTNHLIDFFGGAIFNLHQLSIVPGVGHDGRAMFQSTCGLYHLYDYGSCTPVPPTSPWSDATTSYLRAINAHGIAMGDFDSDADRDIYLPVYGNRNRLMRNDGPLVFNDVTAPPIDDSRNGMSARWADYDNDGMLDLYLANYRSQGVLFHNEGDGTFADSTRGPVAATGDLCDCAWGDYDNDGDVDLYITKANGQANILLRNDGLAGFVDATASPLGYAGDSRGAVWGDYDNDGDPDLYISANNGNKLFRNNGNSTFTDVTSGPLGNTGGSGSSASWGDYDNDGDLDLYLVNRNHANKLLRNNGAGSFSDVTTSPLNHSAQGWSSSWGDYDNDGLLDLFLCYRNGTSQLYHNDGGGQFSDVTEYPLDRTGDTYGSAWDDLDGDGDLDLALGTVSFNPKIIRNNLFTPNSWLHLNLSGVESNRSAFGARVRVVAGGIAQIREVGGDSGYLAQNSLTVEFGMGTAAVADTVEIFWPSGIHQVNTQVLANQILDVTESSLPAAGGDGIADGFRIGHSFPNPFRATTRIDYEIPEPGPVSLLVFDPAGRLVRTIASGAVLPAGRASIVWDGRWESGAPAPAGVYLCLLRAGGRTGSFRVVRLN